MIHNQSRDNFLIYVINWAGRQAGNWPQFDDSGGFTGFVNNAFAVPEDAIPDDWVSAAQRFIQYGLVSNPNYWPDEDRARTRPSWLPSGWKWS